MFEAGPCMMCAKGVAGLRKRDQWDGSPGGALALLNERGVALDGYGASC